MTLKNIKIGTKSQTVVCSLSAVRPSLYRPASSDFFYDTLWEQRSIVHSVSPHGPTLIRIVCACLR